MNRRYTLFRICCGIAGLVLIGAMWFFSSQTGEESGQLSGQIARFVLHLMHVELSSANLTKAGFIIRKAAHFFLFFLIGLTFGFAFATPDKPLHSCLAVIVAAISAVTDEVHQTYVAQRAGMWQDSLLDMCGAVTGILLAYLILRLVRKRSMHKTA